MPNTQTTKKLRSLLKNLPTGVRTGERITPERIYLPRAHAHLKAFSPNTMLITGASGVGKTFYANALQEPAIRERIYKPEDQSESTESIAVKVGFGAENRIDKETLRQLLSTALYPQLIWQTVTAWQIAPPKSPIRRLTSWPERLSWCMENHEAIARLFQEIDKTLDQKGKYLIVLFDALENLADQDEQKYALIRGLMQTALDMRSHRRLRIKIFLRDEQADETKIANFPDASKILSSQTELQWRSAELYGLLFHHLASQGAVFGDFSDTDMCPIKHIADKFCQIPKRLVTDMAYQKTQFHRLTGPYMGANAKSGLPHTWVMKHLRAAHPDGFLTLLRDAALDTDARYPDHPYPLHQKSLRRAIQ